MWGTVRHGEKQEEQSSQNMLLLYGDVQILQAVAPDFLNIMCHVSKNYFMNTFTIQVRINRFLKLRNNSF